MKLRIFSRDLLCGLILRLLVDLPAVLLVVLLPVLLMDLLRPEGTSLFRPNSRFCDDSRQPHGNPTAAHKA